MKKTLSHKIALSGLFLALALLLPFLTAQIPQIGKVLSPMHIPVLLCGFLCGWPYGLAVGAIAPILRSLLFGMPPIFPVATAMAFELGAYGVFSAFLYNHSKKYSRTLSIYLSLIGAMVAGRIVWGFAMYFLMMSSGNPFTINMFIASAFVNALPGIVLHLLVIPPIVKIALKQ